MDKKNFNKILDYLIIFALSLWPTLHFISFNIADNFIHPRVVYFGLFCGLLFCLKYFFLTYLFKKKDLILSILISFIFSFFLFGSIEKIVIDARGYIEHSAKISLSIQFFLFSILSFILFKIIQSNKKNQLLLTFTTFLLIVPMGKIILLYPKSNNEKNLQESFYDNTNFKNNSNLYYIILDEYAREDILKEVFEIDNTNFIKTLKGMGFNYFPNSYSNYDVTQYSISTTLNMDFHKNNLIWDTDVSVNNSKTLKILKKNGYKNIFIESGGVSFITCNGLEDYCIKGGTIRDDLAILIQMTPLWRLMRSSTFHRYFEALYILTDLKQSMEQTLEIMKTDKSKFFVFAHILSPHDPQRYNSDCSKYFSINPSLGKGTKAQYINDLPCLNRDVISSVKSLIKNDKSDPIIIISSDHGISGSMVGSDDEIIRLKNLLLIKNPTKCNKYLSKQITPVNLMSFSISCLQDKKIPFVEDKHYIWNVDPKGLIEVSSQVEKERQENNF